MLRIGIAALVFASMAMAEGFTFTIGSPVASQDYRFKAAAFVFRTENCAEPSQPQISASAEGIVNGERRSVVLRPMAGGKPGVYGIAQAWPNEGRWVVSLKGTCANSTAGAIVPIGRGGFIRESSKFFPRPATEREIDASLKDLEQGGGK